MASKKPKTIAYRRRRENKTNYHTRLKLLKSGIARVVVRFSNTKVVAQVVEFDVKGDKTLVGVDSSNLRAQGWKYSCKNTPAAYLTGLLLAKKAASQNIGDVIFDVGLKSPLHGSKVYAFLQGAREGGLQVRCSEDVYCKAERVQGNHIQAQVGKVKGNHFSKYLKDNAEPGKIAEAFTQMKEKLQS